MCLIIVVPFNSLLFTSEGRVGFLLVISSHNFLLCLSFSASTNLFNVFLQLSLVLFVTPSYHILNFPFLFSCRGLSAFSFCCVITFFRVSFIFLFFLSEFYLNFPVDSFLLSCLPHCLKFCQINMKVIFSSF